MNYKIVVDSCCELPETYKNDKRFQIVPLGLEVGDYVIQDDETFDQKEFLRQVAAYPLCPKSSCPSPEKFREAYHDEAEEVYVVTLSSRLRGGYIVEYKEAGLSFEETVEKVEIFKRQMRTYFVLDNLETLRKNGRLSGVKALVASTLNIKPVMVGNLGVIEQKGQAIGINKALAKMADCIVSDVKNPQERTLMITHCNCPERAAYMRELMEKRASYRRIVVMDSSMYANDGGVIVTL